MSPVVAVNVPDVERRRRAPARHASRHRSAIRCPASPRRSSIPETGEGPLFDQRGPAAGQRARTACSATSASPSRPREVMRDGWYVTGDIAIDRRERLHPHHRPAVAVQQDRRRDGAAHEGRGGDHRGARRRRTPRWSPPCRTNREASGSWRSTPTPSVTPAGALGAAVPDRAAAAVAAEARGPALHRRASRRSAPARSTSGK